MGRGFTAPRVQAAPDDALESISTHDDRPPAATAARLSAMTTVGALVPRHPLAESERQFRLLVAGVVDYAIYMLDLNGIVMTWNSGAERSKEYAASDVVGRHFSCFYTAEDRAAGAPDRALATAMGQGRFHGEGWRVRKDGTRFWADIVIDKICDEDGQPLGFGNITHDITEKRNAERAVRTSERRFRAYAEMAADWFWEQDTEFRFVYESRIQLASLPTDVGKTRWELADPAMDPRRWEPHKADLAAKRPFRDFRWERIGTDGRRRFFSTSGAPIFDEAGTFLGYHGTGRDITPDVEMAEELRRSKDAAEAANRAKSAFLANISHELRTPLNVIIGFAELIQDQASGHTGPSYGEWAGEILAGGRRLLHMINSVLDLSSIEAGTYQLSKSRVDLTAVVRGCLDVVTPQAAANGVRIVSAVPESHILLSTDGRACRQIVLNLLDNAVRFSRTGGTVSVRLAVQVNGDIALVVADTGTGIDPEVLSTLSEPFMQANASLSRTSDGLGLGLAISKKLASLLGGSVTIESALGQGTTVVVRFPGADILSEHTRSGSGVTGV